MVATADCESVQKSLDVATWPDRFMPPERPEAIEPKGVFGLCLYLQGTPKILNFPY
ncbi:hypothetical protein TA5114_02337 [Cognatishimia activa]|uniref:Uncharacterized protein n=1 Tax=Cognatishimia activa TaxID=1715691 RepID=A0A0P1ISR3_9RHOB|nr:hypothetical protein TA5113_01163 [Cognatishimia activa]CUK26522.1 hypothetical protein TA5114_02337 [Cognatishimia activa]